MGQLLTETTPDGSVTSKTYNRRGLLETVKEKHPSSKQELSIINSIDYNAYQQRTQIIYGNGVTTTHTYEATTQHLMAINSKRSPRGKNGKSRSTVVQDITYAYDPVGNITRSRDATYKTVFNKNQKVEPLSDYSYDPLYRLVRAKGRQHPGITQGTYRNNEKDGDVKQSKFASVNDGQALENYQERYTYDDANNLLNTIHKATKSWTRKRVIQPDSNRLKSVSDPNGGDQIPVPYDSAGNMKQLQVNNAVNLKWNCCGNLIQAGIIERPDQPSDSDYYNYDSGEMRTRKVVESMANGSKATHREIRVYMGNYEEKVLVQEFKKGAQKQTLQRQTLRVMDGDTCVAILHYWVQDENEREVEKAGTNRVRFQLANHLGSVSSELAGDASLISYEEYFPYGGTALMAGHLEKEVKLKDYRYSGKERDDSTGLYYYGARYYAPWLSRWLSSDPAKQVDGQNLYSMVRSNPLRHQEIGGKSARDPNSPFFQPGQRFDDHPTYKASAREIGE